jgi:hypothetical protein
MRSAHRDGHVQSGSDVDRAITRTSYSVHNFS